jgi:hypothetical protein
MVKSQNKTRKRQGTKKVKTSILTIPQLRKAFDHMDKVVEGLRKTAKHSFSDAVVTYREEWRKTFKRDLSPADAAAYLKFRYGMKSSSSTRRSRTRGGAMPIAGAPLDYQLRPGQTGVYGHFPTYQQQGLDRYYHSAIDDDCGKPNGFSTDGSGASQAGGDFSSSINGLFRPLLATPVPNMAYTGMMVDVKGTPAYPSADPTGTPPLRIPPTVNIPVSAINNDIRTLPGDVYVK